LLPKLYIIFCADMTDLNASVIVTGATSQIGRFALPRLVAQGFTVHALSRNPPSTAEPGIIWHQTDIIEGPLPPLEASILIHLAHLALLPMLISKVCQENTGHLRRVVAFGSTSVFSKQDSPDPRERAVAAELAAAELAVAAGCEARGIAWTLLRPTLIYGCGLDKNVSVIAKFIRRFGFFPLVGAGNGLRQPVHADDLAAACVAAISCPASYNRAYNLSGGETLAYRKMVERIFVSLGKKPSVLSIPLPIFQAVMKAASLLPRYRFFSAEMASRMNQDLCFGHTEASQDFGYAPRGFDPFVH
jgi:nucleoside-diphosphate-sugar epimerase